MEMKNDDRLMFLLYKAQHVLFNHVKKALTDQDIKITIAQSGILFLLKQRAHTMTELSQELLIDNSAITGLVDRLEKSGFAKREINPADRRTFLISITAEGIEEIGKAKKPIKEMNQKIKDGFSETEIESFKKVLNGFFTKFSGLTQYERN